MAERALGLIEVRGYLGAVVAADTALKAANVSLLHIETIRSGLNTVQLIGDVSAVRAAVDAAVDAVKDEPYYLASHVISRLDQQTNLLFPRKAEKEKGLASEKAVQAPKVAPSLADSNSEEVDKSGKYSQEELQKLKVVQLRSLAYQEEGIRLTKKEIKFANKKTLIDSLLSLGRKEE